MDYYLLTDMAAQIGYELAAAGAETFRIEETMRRVLAAYGIECEAFAIPNCVMVSLEADNGKPLMVMKRVGFHGNDLDAVERSTRSRAASAPKRPTPPLPRNGWRRQETIAAAIPFPFITLAIFLPRPASAPSLAEPCATACGRPDGAYHRLCHAPDG